jgi:glycosidase
MLMMTLPGTAFVYYGEEIGMHDVYTNVPASSKQRTPMQWTSGENAGFSTGNPWLQVALDYKLRNVQVCVITQMAYQVLSLLFHGIII